jgi:hypothetical protein
LKSKEQYKGLIKELFEKICKIDKHLAKLIERKNTHKLIKLVTKRSIFQHVSLKSRGSLGNILKNYTPISWET